MSWNNYYLFLFSCNKSCAIMTFIVHSSKIVGKKYIYFGWMRNFVLTLFCIDMKMMQNFMQNMQKNSFCAKTQSCCVRESTVLWKPYFQVKKIFYFVLNFVIKRFTVDGNFKLIILLDILKNKCDCFLEKIRAVNNNLKVCEQYLYLYIWKFFINIVHIWFHTSGFKRFFGICGLHLLDLIQIFQIK